MGVDGSAQSMEAVDWAAHEARMRGAVLEVVHVDFSRHEVLELFAPHILSFEQSVLDQAVERARTLEESIVVKGQICEPPVASALIQASAGAEMLVLGSRRRTGWNNFALGSVLRECIQHADCPVVITAPTTPRSG